MIFDIENHYKQSLGLQSPQIDSDLAHDIIPWDTAACPHKLLQFCNVSATSTTNARSLDRATFISCLVRIRKCHIRPQESRQYFNPQKVILMITTCITTTALT